MVTNAIYRYSRLFSYYIIVYVYTIGVFFRKVSYYSVAMGEVVTADDDGTIEYRNSILRNRQC